MAHFPKRIDSVQHVIGLTKGPRDHLTVMFADGGRMFVHLNERPAPTLGGTYVRYRREGLTEEGGGYGCFLPADVADALIVGDE